MCRGLSWKMGIISECHNYQTNTLWGLHHPRRLRAFSSKCNVHNNDPLQQANKSTRSYAFKYGECASTWWALRLSLWEYTISTIERIATIQS